MNSTLHYFDLVSEPENKLTLLATAEYVTAAERVNLRDGKASVTFLDEQLRTEFVTISMPWFFPLFEEFKDKIQRLIEAGVCPDRLVGFISPAINQFSEKSGNVLPALVLNMEELAIGFLVCLIPLTLGVVAFICELAVPRIKTFATQTRDMITFLFLIRAVAKTKFERSI